MDSVYRGVSKFYEKVADTLRGLEDSANALVDSVLSYLPNLQPERVLVTTFPIYRGQGELEDYVQNSNVPGINFDYMGDRSKKNKRKMEQQRNKSNGVGNNGSSSVGSNSTVITAKGSGGSAMVNIGGKKIPRSEVLRLNADELSLRYDVPKHEAKQALRKLRRG